MNNSIVRNGLILTAFAIVTTAIIALTYSGTKATIEQQLVNKRLAILNAIVPANLFDNDMQHRCTKATNASLLGSNEAHNVYLGELAGMPSVLAIEATAPNGYSGKIELIVGMQIDGTVTGVRVLNHKETPGLGDKIDLRVSDWILSFDQETVHQDNLQNWQVKKDGGQFDQFTGATITPRAVVKAVKNAVIFAKQNHAELYTSSVNCENIAPLPSSEEDV